MTDRFYPLGKHSAGDVWKTSYEIQNEMRSLHRSAYPPGYAGHEPGAREKFGFSSPGPDAFRLTNPKLALYEDVDIAEPRRIHAMPRLQVTDERQTFNDHDMPEMNRSYGSSIMSPAQRSMAKTRSLPSIQRMPAPPRLSEPAPVKANLDDNHFTYFVPKALSREAPERLMSRSLSRLHKDPEKKVMLPFSGDGTGFRTSCSGIEWWPAASRLHDEPTSYASHFQKPSFFRMSPMQSSLRRCVRLDAEDEDGLGSIRLGTPTPEERIKHPHFAGSALDAEEMKKPCSITEVRPTPAARFGYMPPGEGRIDRSSSGLKIGRPGNTLPVMRRRKDKSSIEAEVDMDE